MAVDRDIPGAKQSVEEVYAPRDNEVGGLRQSDVVAERREAMEEVVDRFVQGSNVHLTDEGGVEVDGEPI